MYRETDESRVKERVSASTFPSGSGGRRRERLFLIASVGVVDKLMSRIAPSASVFRLHPSAPAEGGLFLFNGASAPPVQEGKFAGRHIFPRDYSDGVLKAGAGGLPRRRGSDI